MGSLQDISDRRILCELRRRIGARGDHFRMRLTSPRDCGIEQPSPDTPSAKACIDLRVIDGNERRLIAFVRHLGNSFAILLDIERAAVTFLLVRYGQLVGWAHEGLE